VEYGGQPFLICSRQYEDEDHRQATPQISIEIQRWVTSGSDQKDAESSEPSKRSVVRLSILRVITYRCHSSTTHPLLADSSASTPMKYLDDFLDSLGVVDHSMAAGDDVF
jgi:hypothetical protein